MRGVPGVSGRGEWQVETWAAKRELECRQLSQHDSASVPESGCNLGVCFGNMVESQLRMACCGHSRDIDDVFYSIRDAVHKPAVVTLAQFEIGRACCGHRIVVIDGHECVNRGVRRCNSVQCVTRDLFRRHQARPQSPPELRDRQVAGRHVRQTADASTNTVDGSGFDCEAPSTIATCLLTSAKSASAPKRRSGGRPMPSFFSQYSNSARSLSRSSILVTTNSAM